MCMLSISQCVEHVLQRDENRAPESGYHSGQPHTHTYFTLQQHNLHFIPRKTRESCVKFTDVPFKVLCLTLHCLNVFT